MAPLGLTSPVGTSKTVMPSSPLPADGRFWVVQIQGLPVRRFRSLGHPGIGGTSWFESLMFLDIGVITLLPAPHQVSAPLTLPSHQTGFQRIFFCHEARALGATYPNKAPTLAADWTQPHLPIFHQLRMPLGLLCLPPFLIHCSPEDNKHFRNRFRDSPQG